MVTTFSTTVTTAENGFIYTFKQCQCDWCQRYRSIISSADRDAYERWLRAATKPTFWQRIRSLITGETP